MQRRRLSLLPITLAFALMFPLMAAAAVPNNGERSRSLPDGTVVTLEKVTGGSDIGVLAASTWNAGCRYTATNVLGNAIYSFTIWQTFTSDGTKITSLPTQTTSSSSDLGWSLTSSSSSHRWLNTSHKDADATGNYTFTQYVAGQPFKSVSGWVRVTVHHTGTWDCTSS